MLGKQGRQADRPTDGRVGGRAGRQADSEKLAKHNKKKQEIRIGRRLIIKSR